MRIAFVPHHDSHPREEPKILAVYTRCRARIEAFDLQLVLAPDHFSGFHYSLIQSLCVDLAASAMDHVGWFGGPLDVPDELAGTLAAALVRRGFDPVV